MPGRDEEDKKQGASGPGSSGLDRRAFLRRGALGVGALAVGLAAEGCGSSSSNSADTGGGGTSGGGTSTAVAANVPSSAAWKFAIMADTQWPVTDDGKNPNTCAVDIITKLNAQLVKSGVKFVVHVGDLCDSQSSVNEDTRADFAQALYASGIGFFPLRGNHDDGSQAEFVRLYPQTQGGLQNATPADAFLVANPDSATQPFPAQSGATFSLGSAFASPTNLAGLTYAFTYQNVRFVLLDQFTTPSKLNADGSTYSLATAIAPQQSWIDGQLSAAKAAGNHALVFAHKGLLTEYHNDILFGTPVADDGTGNTTLNAGADAFITSLSDNGVKLFVCGHDHMHDRSLVSTLDGTKRVMQVVSSSNSAKFYIPNATANDVTYYGGKRQTPLSQELDTVGYYLVTVDGNNVSVEFYSAPSHAVVSGSEKIIATTPTLNFTRRERYGYGRGGQEFAVAQGGVYTAVKDTGPGGTQVAILDGTNWNTDTDGSSRAFHALVTTGWLAADGTASDILLLQGLAETMGSGRTDPYVLSLGYAGTFSAADLAAGKLVLAAPDEEGNWVNAASLSSAGTGTFVAGAWDASYVVGTYGVNTATGTVWAVLDYQGYFAAVSGV